MNGVSLTVDPQNRAHEKSRANDQYFEDMKPTVYIETTIVGHLASRLPNDVVVMEQLLSKYNGSLDLLFSELQRLSAERARTTQSIAASPERANPREPRFAKTEG